MCIMKITQTINSEFGAKIIVCLRIREACRFHTEREKMCVFKELHSKQHGIHGAGIFTTIVYTIELFEAWENEKGGALTKRFRW